MKKYAKNTFLLLALMLLTSVVTKAQAPQSINYQAVARNSSGALMANSSINARFTIHQGSASGTTVYQETHSATTNDYGLFSVKIGEGTVSSGSFAAIDWANNAYYLQVEIDAGSGYADMGSNQLVSVPYSLYSAEAGNVITYTGGSGISLSGTTFNAQTTSALWNANKLQGKVVASTAPSSGQVLKWNGSAWTPSTDNTGSGSVWSQSGSTAYYNTGNVGIGTTTPAYPLDISSPNQGVLRLNSTTNPLVIFTSSSVSKAFIQYYSGSFLFRTYGSDYISLGTNNSDDLHITSAGKIGIGTTAPAGQVEIKSNSTTNSPQLLLKENGSDFARLSFANTTNSTKYWSWAGYTDATNSSSKMNLWYYNGTSGSDLFSVTGSGNVGIGTSTPTYQLEIVHGVYGLDLKHGTKHWELYTSNTSGDLYLYANGSHRGTFNASTGAYTSVSDQRLKENIHSMPNVLQSVMDLKPMSYNFIGSSTQTTGFIAQELIKAFPQYVIHNIDKERNLDQYTVDYAGMSVVAIKAIQEQQKLIKDLQKQINELKSQINK